MNFSINFLDMGIHNLDSHFWIEYLLLLDK